MRYAFKSEIRNLKSKIEILCPLRAAAKPSGEDGSFDLWRLFCVLNDKR
jgi:hypothetical protein